MNDRKRAAEAALELAVKELREAYIEESGSQEDFGILSQWVLIGLDVGTDEQGGWSHDFCLTPDDGDLMPISNVLGLLRVATVKIEAQLGRDRSKE